MTRGAAELMEGSNVGGEGGEEGRVVVEVGLGEAFESEIDGTERRGGERGKEGGDFVDESVEDKGSEAREGGRGESRESEALSVAEDAPA